MEAVVPRGDEDRVAFDEGMVELERLFRISPSNPSLDAIIVYVDLEASGSKEKIPAGEQKGGLRHQGSWVRCPRYPGHNSPFSEA